MDQSTLARRLPEEFLELPGSPSQRALLIVYRRWTAYPDTEQAQLAQTLLSLLEPLLRSVAEATLDALRQAVPERGLRFELQDVGSFEACGHSGMLVALQVKHKERSWSLIGLCADTREDQFGATALAVLNGTNRLLGTG